MSLNMENAFRNLPDFKGKRRLAKFLFREQLNSVKEVQLRGKYSCSYFVPNLRENVGLDIFVNGVYEEDTIDFLDKHLPPNGGYLDLGANIGAVVIPLCKRRPDIKAIAVEAAPWVFNYLEKNIRLNQLDNIVSLNNALFDKDNEQMDFFSPEEKFGKGSLAPVFSQDAVKVNSKKVDTILREQNFAHVNAVKADVEGFEYFVFKGGKELFSRPDAPDIVFEFVDWAEALAMGLTPGSAQKLLKEYHYDLYKIEKSKLVKLDAVLESGAAELFATKRAM